MDPRQNKPNAGDTPSEPDRPIGHSGGSRPAISPAYTPWFRVLIWAGLAILIVSIVQQPRSTNQSRIPYSQFKIELRNGNVAYAEAEGETIRGRLREAIAPAQPRPRAKKGEDAAEPASQSETEAEPEPITQFTTVMPPFGDQQLMGQLSEHDVEFVSQGSGDNFFWLALINVLPFLLLIGLGIYWVRNMSQRAQGMMSIGQSKAKKFDREQPTANFDDVAGADNAKHDLQEIIRFLKNPKQFADLGAELPKGMLLVGPPGTGKTLLARAVAGEANVPFFSITGSDFMEMFVGVGASRVRNLFEIAKKSAPCIVFLDELDSIGRQRGAGLGGGHDEREQTLNQLLSELDGFEPNESVILMAATNRPDILDPALLRPGRFDRQVTVDLPTKTDRVAILKVHTRNVPLADDVDLENVAKSMPGRSGADLKNLVNEAALVAAQEGKDRIEQSDFTAARDKILMGRVRSGVVLEGRERRIVAVHEAGHALVAHLTPEADPVEKISIIARGRALGATQQLGEERYNYGEDYLRSRLKMMLGGRAAEECVFDTVSTGAADDLARVAELARKMVSEWGMSEKFRHLAFEHNGHSRVFLGEQIAERRPYSEETAREIDLEVKNVVESCYNDAMEILKKNRERLEQLADALEEEETLEGEPLARALGKKAAAE